jgi:hypothetical protein
MPDHPPIPHGYRLVQGPAQKGDGVWDGTRFRKARKQYPSTEPAIIIRRCEVVQEALPGVEVVAEMEVD